MNKKIIISIIFFIIIILLFVIGTRDTKKVLVCNGDVIVIGGQANQEYTFEGVNGFVKKEKLEVRLIVFDDSSMEEFIEILKNNKDCTDLYITDDFISYTCNYDLEKNHYYAELEDSKNRLPFDVIKEKMEEDNFVCTYE